MSSRFRRVLDDGVLVVDGAMGSYLQSQIGEPRASVEELCLSAPDAVDEKQLTRVAAIIDSMTPEERQYPQVLNGSRKKRIAGGAGSTVAEINRLLKQYQQMKKLMKAARKGMRGLDLSRLPLPAPKGIGDL